MNNSFKTIFKTFGIKSLGQLLNILNQLALVPIYIKVWGPQLYGEWLILSAAPSLIAMAGDFGFATVASNEMNLAIAKGDRQSALIVFQNNWIAISVFSLFFFVIAVSAINVVSVGAFLKIHIINISDTQAIIALLLFNLLMWQQIVLLIGALRSDGNYVLGVTIVNASKLIELVVTAILLVEYHAKPFYLVVSTVVITFALFVTNIILVRKRSPWIQYGTKYFSLQIIKAQTPVALSFLSFPIVQALSIQASIILTGLLLGPAAVVVLSTTRTFMNVIKQAVTIISSSVWPELTTAYGQNDLPRFQAIFIRAVQAVMLLAISFNIGLALLGKQFYLFWTKNKIAFNNYFFYLFGIVTSINAIWNIFGMAQIATNQTKKYAVYNIVSSLLLLISILFTSKSLGLLSIILGMLLSETFMFFFIIRNALTILHIKSELSFFASFFRFRQKNIAF